MCVDLTVAVLLVGVTVSACLVWERHGHIITAWLLGLPFLVSCLTRKDQNEIDQIEDVTSVIKSQNLRQWRRKKPAVIGIKSDKIISKSATSGYKWKKKWRDRKIRSKEKRKLKHEERKKRRAIKAAAKAAAAAAAAASDESDGSDDDSDSDSDDSESDDDD
ncbi:nucleolin-like [Littorina saxatilis]|uniref:nucleolin-like n=1 Tax=Littorina saxatilis TaxID=31220 RepID=UPI0038B59DFD